MMLIRIYTKILYFLVSNLANFLITFFMLQETTLYATVEIIIKIHSQKKDLFAECVVRFVDRRKNIEEELWNCTNCIKA